MFSCTIAQHIYCTNTVQNTYIVQMNCTYSKYTEAAAKCSAAQQHSTAHLLYKYCTNWPVWNWTVLTAITQKLLLHIQLHNSAVYLLYKYCTNCRVCIWTVLTVITQKVLLHVQPHNSTAHLLYKYCSKCTVCNWTVLTLITQKLLLHVQLHNSTGQHIHCTITV